MNTEHLLAYIMDGTKNQIVDVLESWITTSVRFRDFAHYYRDKIRGKMHSANNDIEKMSDVQFELEVAYLLLSDKRFDVEYETYKAQHIPGPDFSANFDQSIEFNLEVKRIRESSLGSSYDKLIQDIADKIQKLPSSLAFSLVVDDLDVVDEEIVNRLESLKEVVIQYIENCVRSEEDKLASDDVREYPIPGLEDALILMLSKPSGKITNDETSYNGGSSPVFYTQREYCKIGDIMIKSLRQMLPKMINVLVISSNSSTHEENDLFKSIYSINRLLRIGDDGFFVRKGFRGRQAFLNQSKRLSGILFRSNWISLGDVKDRNLLWCNEMADQQIPEAIKEYLRRMNKRALWSDGRGEKDN